MKRINSFLLFSCAALFCIYYLGLQWNNRPSYEENLYICRTLDKGFWNVFVDFYFHWCGRWSGRILLGLVNWLASVSNEPWKVFFGAMFWSFSFLVCSVYFFLSVFLKEYLFYQISKINLFSYALLLVSAFYFGSFQIIESWYWLTSVIPSLIIIACIFTGAAILISKKSTKIRWLILSTVCLFVSGSAETFSVPVFLIVTSLLFYKIIKEGIKTLFTGSSEKKVAWTWIILFVGITFNVVSPGNMQRFNQQKGQTYTSYLTGIPKFSKKFSGHYTIPQTIKEKSNREWLLVMLPFLFIGTFFKQDEKLNISSAVKPLKFLILCLFITSASTLLITEIVFGNLGPVRLWLPFSLIVTVIICYTFFYFGIKINPFLFRFPFIKSLVLVLILYLFSRLMIAHIPNAIEYSTAYDNRINHLRQLKAEGIKGVVEVEKLPVPFLFISGDIATTTFWSKNTSFSCANGFAFEVKQK